MPPTGPTPAAAAKSPAGTREKLLLAAEALFAQEGVDGVSMRRINRAAGQSNASALHYHFGSRLELVAAIINRRMGEVNARRRGVLDRLIAAGDPSDPRQIADALIAPLAEQVNHGDGASNYIRCLAGVYFSSEVDVDEITRGHADDSLRDVAELFAAALPDIPVAIVRQRFAMSVRNVVYTLADWERQCLDGQRPPRLQFPAFVENLIDMTGAAMAAPLSAETQTKL